uniref:DNA-directed RNA polymerase n=1 Tax=viral metagenome TaxID=1070528 RepID=A0A6C0C364_9ZZZZ
MEPSKIIGIQFSVLSPEEIKASSVAEIVSRDTYINNKPVMGGLFDPRMGVLDPGLICPTDGLNYMQTPGYFGHIELARPIFYIQYLESIKKILRCICIRCSKLKISKHKHQFCLKLDGKKRWDYVFKEASKIRRCGEETCDGCGTKQPRKIYKEGLATIMGEWENTDKITDENGAIKNKLIIKYTPEQVIKLFRRISDEDVSFMGFSPIFSRPEWFVCQVLAVPPPAVRPSVKHNSQQRSEDDISHIIVNIIKANKTLQEKIQQNANQKVIDDWTTVLQYYCATMIDNKIPGVAAVAQRSGRALKSIKERLVGKQGRVRGNLMGKRVDFSARSVIGPDPNLSIRELGVPVKIAKNITFPAKVNKRNKAFLTKLVQNGPDKYPGANVLEKYTGLSISLRHKDKSNIRLDEGDVVHRHMLDGDPILFNRQPTLHRMSMMCHIAKIMHVGSTFRMNVADTKPYNADFDGDEMNLHGPQDEESQAELMYLAAVPKHIISPANNKSIVGVFQDSLLASYRFTRKNINFTHRQAMNLLMYYNNVNVNLFKNNKKKKITSFQVLSQILPPISTRFPNGQYNSDENKKTSNNIIEIVNGVYKRGLIDKGVLSGASKGLLQHIFNDFSHQHSSDFIDNLQSIVTEYMKLTSYSVGISDLISDEDTNSKIISEIITKKKNVKKLINQLHLDVFENNTGKSNEVEFETQVNSILNDARAEAGKIGRKNLDTNNRFIMMVNAGSKGSNINIAQMISCVGQQNVDGKRIPYGYEDRTLPHYCKYDDSPESRGFVESSFIQGLTPEELYFHAMGGRTGLIDTAVKTSQTGYIQRRLIKGMEDLKVVYDMTVRNNKGKIIQFKYGEDSINACKSETQNLPVIKMTLEEIFAHFQIPEDDKTNKMLTTNYTKEALKRKKKEKKQLIIKTKKIIDYVLDSRKLIIENVCKYRDNMKIYIPVHFNRLMNNIQHGLQITANFMIDITPLEVYKLLDHYYGLLEANESWKPTKLFKIAYYYYLSPKELLVFRKFNRKTIILLLETIVYNFKKAIVHPGEMVGMIAAQSIGEPTTQMTLNTFHFAGVASKSNVTRGVPRIEEILSLSENPKNPSVTIRLKEHEEEFVENAQKIKYSLEHTTLRDVTKTVSIMFDPERKNTLIDSDKNILEKYHLFENMIKESMEDKEEEKEQHFSKWIIRFEFEKELMLEKMISMDDIHFAINSSLKNNVECIFNDFNSENLIFRIRLEESLINNKKSSLDQEDHIYMLKNLQENLLDNIILRGIKKIPKIVIRKLANNLKLKNGNYQPQDVWVLDTVGSNLIDILALDNIDKYKTTSNDIQEVYKTLGVEAARQTIYNEIEEVMSFDGTYINHRHMGMLSDRMTATQNLVSIFRHGINNDDIGPIAKASFEETPEMFLRAAKHAELDLMTGVSSNVMVGQEGKFGTGSFQVLLNLNEMKKLEKEKIKSMEETMEDVLNNFDLNDKCSINKININHSEMNIKAKNIGNVDDDYDMGF